jgi:isoleucyl-tRNA synthetase
VVVLGEHVTLEQGTGLVHTAPGHGQEDYDVGIQYGLDIYNPVLADGRFDDTVQPPELRGVKVFEANPRIVQLLVERGVLLNRPTDTVEHSYRTAGAATIRSSSARRPSGSSPWIDRWMRPRVWTPRCGARR